MICGSISQRLKNAAARGITDAWDALGGIVGDDASAYLEIFPVIFPPLDSLKIPDELDLKNPSKPVVLARYALEALYTGLVFSPLNGNQISRVEQSIERHWQDIWAWCNFFFLRVIEADISDSIHGDSEEELFQVRVFYTVAYVFNGLAKFENTRAMLKETRDFPRIIASMWLQAHKHYPRSVEATTKALYLLVPDQTDQSLVSCSVPEPWISAFVSTLHDHSSQLVDLFFSRITDLALGPEIRCIPLKLELPLLINSITLSPELTRAILARGAIRTVTFMMSRLASRKERFHVQQMNNATDCLHIGARFLCTHLREGPRWIIQALEGRLILTVFRTGGFTRCNGTAGLHRVSKLDEDFGELLTIITPYIVYPSILRLVEKAIRTYRSRCLHTDSVPSAFLRDAWDELVNRAENEREIMTLARYMGHVSFVLQICANKEVLHFYFIPHMQSTNLTYSPSVPIRTKQGKQKSCVAPAAAMPSSAPWNVKRCAGIPVIVRIVKIL